jgi:hypothetical protein
MAHSIGKRQPLVKHLRHPKPSDVSLPQRNAATKDVAYALKPKIGTLSKTLKFFRLIRIPKNSYRYFAMKIA